MRMSTWTGRGLSRPAHGTGRGERYSSASRPEVAWSLLGRYNWAQVLGLEVVMVVMVTTAMAAMAGCLAYCTSSTECK
eukprot:SAG25_NODE_5614_length_638_cov_1.205937_1_plen_77_part_10